MSHHKLALKVYDHLAGLCKNGEIPISLRAPELVGTVQDDPFDSWVGSELHKALPSCEVIHTGKLTTPDIIIRDKAEGTMLGLEVKKLIQMGNGADPRGLTLDYNSCLPCGKAMIKVGGLLTEIPCFYLFALLNPKSNGIVTLLVMDGDFLNYDFDLHKQAKIANTTLYNHGPYGEGSVRGRAMYTYPNPLNYKITRFHLQKLLVIKKIEADNLRISSKATCLIERKDIYDNTFVYSAIALAATPQINNLPVLSDIFASCKAREAKIRVASTPRIRPLI